MLNRLPFLVSKKWEAVQLYASGPFRFWCEFLLFAEGFFGRNHLGSDEVSVIIELGDGDASPFGLFGLRRVAKYVLYFRYELLYHPFNSL